jgi:putative oxidoreductase
MLRTLERWYDLAMTRVFDRLRSPLLLALRLIFGWGLFQIGKGKLENIDRFVDFLAHLHIPIPHACAWFVASLECVGGLLLLLGLAARIIAIPLTINFIVAFMTADHDAVVNFFKDQEAFTNAAPFLYLLVSLIVLAFGPGIFSLDEVIRRMRRRPVVSAQSPLTG